MAEYLDRKAFKEEYLCCGYLPEMSEEEFDAFPAADVSPVVRCKNCRYNFRNSGHDKDGCPITDNDIWMGDNGFCSCGAIMDLKGEQKMEKIFSYVLNREVEYYPPVNSYDYDEHENDMYYIGDSEEENKL